MRLVQRFRFWLLLAIVVSPLSLSSRVGLSSSEAFADGAIGDPPPIPLKRTIVISDRDRSGALAELFSARPTRAIVLRERQLLRTPLASETKTWRSLFVSLKLLKN